jgi:hypothetical protein
MLWKYASAMPILDRELAGGRGQAPVLPRTAHRHTFVYEARKGFLYVRSRAISSRCNDNFDEFPAEEIRKGYRTFIGKPVFVNHRNEDHRRARGVIIDAALHDDVNPDGTEDTWVEVLMEVDAVRFPMLAKAILAGDIDRTSMGTDVAYSVCTACGNKASTPADYCRHIPRMKGQKIVRHNAATGKREEVLIAERCYGLRFFENSLLVEEPADPTAFFLGVEAGPGVTAVRKQASLSASLWPFEAYTTPEWDDEEEKDHPRHGDGKFRRRQTTTRSPKAGRRAPSPRATRAKRRPRATAALPTDRSRRPT